MKSGLRNRPPENLPNWAGSTWTGPFDFSLDSASPTTIQEGTNQLWNPLPGPQTQALESEADELYYGGGAGGGKSDLILGWGLTRAHHGIVFRRTYKQLLGPQGLISRSREIVAQSPGAQFNGSQNVWRIFGGRQLEFGAVEHETDKINYQGRAHDFKAFDELPQFTESQYLYLIGWARTTRPGQRVRVIATGNPPQSTEGEWVIQRWAAWLDENHPNPARPGELRWYVRTSKDIEHEVKGPAQIELDDEILTPKSRTFIPARVQDNPFLMESDYLSQLQQLPEPLRSQLIFGDYTIGLQADPWQVIPTAWILAAQERWHPKSGDGLPLSAVGCDVAQGGGDRTVLARRKGTWFAELQVLPGVSTPDANANASLVLAALVDGGYAVIDANGIGASTHFLVEAKVAGRSRAYLGSDSTTKRDASGTLEFRNVRAAAYWTLREALDPAKGEDLALPPDRQLRVELAAARWATKAGGVQIESKEDIIKRLGRSPDLADAVVMAWWNDPGAALASAFAARSIKPPDAWEAYGERRRVTNRREAPRPWGMR